MRLGNFILLGGFVLTCFGKEVNATELLELKPLGKKLSPSATRTEEAKYYQELMEKLKLKQHYDLSNQLALFKFEALGFEYYEWDGRQVYPLSKSNFLLREEKILAKNQGNGFYLIATSWRRGDIFNGERHIVRQGKCVYPKYHPSKKEFELTKGALFTAADTPEKIIEKIKSHKCGVILSSFIKDNNYNWMVEHVLFRTKFIEK